MAEPTCVVHPFSYTSPAFSSETLQEENPSCIYGVEESVSFGRFMSENLSWERWSSFSSNRNRYVEEAEKYSRSGSVAQKKAYFEVHFKRMAALKVAALLEQDAHGGPGPETGVPNESGSSHGVKDLGIKAQILAHNTNEGGGSNEVVQGFVVHQNELYTVSPGNDEELSETNEAEVVKTATPPPVQPAGPSPPPPPAGPPPAPPPPPGVGLALAGSVETAVDDKRMLEQSEVTVMKDEDWNGIQKVLSVNGIVQMEKPPLQKANLKGEEVAAPIVKKNPPLSSFISPAYGIGKGVPPLFAPSPAKSAAAPVHPGKENYAISMKKNSSSMADPDKKTTPLRASLNREFNRILSPVIRKIGSSSKTSKNCSTPLKTPSKGSVNGAPEPAPLLTPDSTKKGVRSHHDSPTGHRKPAGPRWHILSEGLKSPNNNRNKTSSPIIPTSFCLRSQERAQRRKQKLEDKFNATTTEKAPQPSKFKEKAEAELNRFRQSFCFKVMSSPDHYTEAEFQSKNESTKQAGRQANTSTSQSRSSLPPRRPTVKASSLKNVNGRNSSSSSLDNNV